jgi:hypothetical protein
MGQYLDALRKKLSTPAEVRKVQKGALCTLCTPATERNNFFQDDMAALRRFYAEEWGEFERLPLATQALLADDYFSNREWYDSHRLLS